MSTCDKFIILLAVFFLFLIGCLGVGVFKTDIDTLSKQEKKKKQEKEEVTKVVPQVLKIEGITLKKNGISDDGRIHEK